MKSHILQIAALAAISFAACKKPYDSKVIPPTPVGGGKTLASAMAEVAVTSKTVTIDATTGGSFFGNSGTSYQFPANSFRTASGTLVSGNVEIEVIEYLKESDMLFSGVLPVSGGEPLLSGGEINIKARQGGQQLFMMPGTMFTATMPVPGVDPVGMKLFLGQQDEGQPVNWQPADTATAGGGGGGQRKGGVFTAPPDSISIISDSIGLCNADQFMSNPDYQSFTLTVTTPDGTIHGDSVAAYALYDTYNGVWPFYTNTGNVFTEGHVPNIPVHFVVMGTLNGYFYGGILAATPANGTNYTINITKIDPLALKALVDGL